MTNFHTEVEGNDYIFATAGAAGQGVSFTRLNYKNNKYTINAKLAISKGVRATSEVAFDARTMKHAISHGVAGTPDLPQVFGEEFTLAFEHWADYTNFCQFCNISSAIFNDLTRPLSSASVSIVEVGHDTTMMQRPCVTLSWHGKTVEHITLIQLKEYTVSKPSLMFQVGGGLGADQLHFYSEPDLRDVYAELKRVLKPTGIMFESVLTD